MAQHTEIPFYRRVRQVACVLLLLVTILTGVLPQCPGVRSSAPLFAVKLGPELGPAPSRRTLHRLHLPRIFFDALYIFVDIYKIYEVLYL